MVELSKPKVSIVKVEGRKDKKSILVAVQKALEYFGGIKNIVRPGEKVMIKPNFTGDLTPESGAVTSPDVLEAIILLLKEAGVNDIIIAEGCGTIHIGTKRIFRNTGVEKIAQIYNIKLVDLNTDKMRVIRDPDFIELDEVKVAETVFNVDKIINVPVLKTHSLTSVTIALKNMKGVIAPPDKRRFHNLILHKAVADLNSVLPKYFTIVDALVCQEGLGPAEGTPVNLGLIIAGDNSVAVDAVGTKVMGFDPEKVEHIKYSAEKGIGSYKSDDIEVLGNKISDIAHPFKPAEAEIKSYKNVEIIANNACSGCIAAVIIALDRMKNIKDLDKFSDFQIFMGSGAFPVNKSKKCFFVGHCTKGAYNKYIDEENVYLIEGCAPAGLEVEERIREKFNIPRSL